MRRYGVRDMQHPPQRPGRMPEFTRATGAAAW